MKEFISNNFNVNNFAQMNFGEQSQDRIVVIANAYMRPSIIILDATDKNNEEKEELVKQCLNEICSGCIYKYEIIEVIGNVYFCN